MQADVDLVNIPPYLSTQIKTIVEDMNRKLAKAKLPPVTPDQLLWSYQWGVMLGNGHDALDNCFVSLCGSIGRRQSLAPFPKTQGPDNSTPRTLIPQEVAALYAPMPKVDDTYPHVAKFTVVGTAKPTLYATGGYTDGKNIYIANVYEGQDISKSSGAFETLLLIKEQTATWNGALVPKAKAAYNATPEDGIFKYRNKKFRRLKKDEIISLVSGKTFQHSF